MLSRIKTRFFAILQFLTSSVWFAYVTLALLQFKVVFGMWFFRDMTAGDSSGYFVTATSWYSQTKEAIFLSPLYTAFLGTLLNFTDNAYAAVIAHRLILVFVVSMLVLALMRRLLPHSIAWLISVWWVITPNNFDLLYEVHLFTAIPILVACLVALYKPTIWTRGAVLGIFLASAVLVRNELVIATGLWVAICGIWELYQARNHNASSPTLYIRAYGIPLVLVIASVSFFYWRSLVQFPDLSQSFSGKETLNLCQVYAYNYQQRNTDWTENSWTQCQDLMMRDFGVPQPSFGEAVSRNPRAMLDFVLWNVRLMPDGIQDLLFNGSAGTGQPDYIPKVTNAPYALVFSLLAIAVLGIGLWLMRRRRQWHGWIRERGWGWLALGCTVIVTLIVMLTQRSRPEYMLNLFYFLTAVIGMCVFAIVDRSFGIKRFSLLLPIIAVVLLVLIPSDFTPEYHNPYNIKGRPLVVMYTRLLPYTALLSEPGARLLTNGWASDVCHYLTYGICQPSDYYSLISKKPGDLSLADWLVQQKVTIFYVDEGVFADPAAQSFLKDPQRAGWDTVAWAQTGDVHWELLKRRAPSTVDSRQSRMVGHF